MIIINNIEECKIKKSAIALGKFDGVHRGHQKILQELKKNNDAGTKTVVITFSVSPEAILSGKQLKYIMTDREKQEYFSSWEIDYLIDICLDEKFLSVEAEQFVLNYLVGQLGARKIVCGFDFCFGKNRRGNVSMLKKFGESCGFLVILVDHLSEQGSTISSTRIRDEILSGNIEAANRMLGHPYTITGVVQHGNQLGRTIHFPTVNILPANEKILPPNGVYVSDIIFENEKKSGITNIGVKPTVRKNDCVNVETNIFDFSGDLYDKIVTVQLKKFIREEQKFSSMDELKRQIQMDIEMAKAF